MGKFGRMISNTLVIIILVAVVLAVLPALWNLVWGYVVTIVAIITLIVGFSTFLRLRKKKNGGRDGYNEIHYHYH